jgi:hypothetical protein
VVLPTIEDTGDVESCDGGDGGLRRNPRPSWRGMGGGRGAD